MLLGSAPSPGYLLIELNYSPWHSRTLLQQPKSYLLIPLLKILYLSYGILWSLRNIHNVKSEVYDYILLVIWNKDVLKKDAIEKKKKWWKEACFLQMRKWGTQNIFCAYEGATAFCSVSITYLYTHTHV